MLEVSTLSWAQRGMRVKNNQNYMNHQDWQTRPDNSTARLQLLPAGTFKLWLFTLTVVFVLAIVRLCAISRSIPMTPPSQAPSSAWPGVLISRSSLKASRTKSKCCSCENMIAMKSRDTTSAGPWLPAILPTSCRGRHFCSPICKPRRQLHPSTRASRCSSLGGRLAEA